MRWCADNPSSPSLAWIVVIKRFQTHSNISIPTPVGELVCVYGTAATIRQGAKSGTGTKVLKANLYLNLTSAPRPPTPRRTTAALWPPNCSTLASPTTCRVLTPTVEPLVAR